ncbi:hypothetical protein CEUSTIGMA_g6934.t1 [Chlamydomonas eustigma]|uniref:DNL-type domain-containing protein n=1 Tax=Chlamydomonas eustigma TaxID=1157962 RepID=A0A250X8U2_9CHLO|nr:hypothetical protein CEUSTIGMA_g6934.t1 [Chlamydomonas eustigma]|eukprot:GAX79493.1 hypothetical protein CEUSTIGMA_g6934.t1 [Chlamydomonas eustigma]
MVLDMLMSHHMVHISRDATFGFKSFLESMRYVHTSINISGSNSKSDQSQETSTSVTPIGRIQPKLAMAFTCGKCDTRSVKTFSRSSYEKGVVLVRCPCCESQHLIADHLGWFGDQAFTVEQLRESGTRVLRISGTDLERPVTLSGSQNLTAEDVLGWSKVELLMKEAAKKGALDTMTRENVEGSTLDSALGGKSQFQSVHDVELEGVVEITEEDMRKWRKVSTQLVMNTSEELSK